MRSTIVLGLTALVTLSAALPQTAPAPSTLGVYTPPSKLDAFRAPGNNLPRRYYGDGNDGGYGGYGDGDQCVECPPEDYPYKGCLYIECDDCSCEKEDCCSCIGLTKDDPYVWDSLDVADQVVPVLSNQLCHSNVWKPS
jgi:hypothetical protein